MLMKFVYAAAGVVTVLLTIAIVPDVKRYMRLRSM